MFLKTLPYVSKIMTYVLFYESLDVIKMLVIIEVSLLKTNLVER